MVEVRGFLMERPQKRRSALAYSLKALDLPVWCVVNVVKSGRTHFGVRELGLALAPASLLGRVPHFQRPASWPRSKRRRAAAVHTPRHKSRSVRRTMLAVVNRLVVDRRFVNRQNLHGRKGDGFAKQPSYFREASNEKEGSVYAR